MKLTDDQIKVVQHVINQSHIEIRTLGEDLLDHLCCAIEQRMETSGSFEVALQESLHELAPDGLDKIQRETIYLLTSNNNIHMKKAMYLIGLLSAMAFISGMTFTLIRFPGARELMNYGFMVFMFVFVPFQAVEFYKANTQRPLPEKLKFVFGFAGGIGLAFAGLLKTFHYPGADELLVAGTLVTVFGFLPLFFFCMYKKTGHDIQIRTSAK